MRALRDRVGSQPSEIVKLTKRKSDPSRIRRAGIALVLALAAAACGEDAQRASQARVVVDADPAEPVSLVVSTNFEMVLDENGQSTAPFFRNTDSLSLTSGYDETYQLDDENPKFYAQLKNESSTPESVRMRVFLDGEKAYDVSVTMANGGYLEYIYQFRDGSTGSNR